MYYVLQLAVAIAVGFAGIYYQWTPNNYLLGVISIGAAYVVTLIISTATERVRRAIRRARTADGQASPQAKPLSSDRS